MKPLLVGAVLMAAAAAIGCGAPARAAGSPQDQMVIAFHFSHFTPAAVTVPAGVPVTFTLQNDDPIDHEWIVGPPEVHAAHRVGTEPVHDSRPTEVTVPALSTRVTMVTFTHPGDYAFICHLPGHEGYGMRGTVHAVTGR